MARFEEALLKNNSLSRRRGLRINIIVCCTLGMNEYFSPEGKPAPPRPTRETNKQIKIPMIRENQ